MIGYLITAALCCSMGFVLGGLAASSKVLGLYGRLEVAERNLAEQSNVMKDMANTMRHVLQIVEGRMVNSIGSQTLGDARGSLARCDALLDRQEQAQSETV